MRPSVGRIVHYVAREPLAAIITAVRIRPLSAREIREAEHPITPDREECYEVALTVFAPPADNRPESRLAVAAAIADGVWADVPFSPEYKPGHWTWPPRT